MIQGQPLACRKYLYGYPKTGILTGYPVSLPAIRHRRNVLKQIALQPEPCRNQASWEFNVIRIRLHTLRKLSMLTRRSTRGVNHLTKGRLKKRWFSLNRQFKMNPMKGDSMP